MNTTGNTDDPLGNLPQRLRDTFVYASSSDSAQNILTSFKLNSNSNVLEQIGSPQSFPFIGGSNASYGLKLVKPQRQNWLLGLTTDAVSRNSSMVLENTVHLFSPDPNSGLLISRDSKFVANNQGGIFAGIDIGIAPSGRWGYLLGTGGRAYGFGVDISSQKIILTGFTLKLGEYPIIRMAFSPDSQFAYVIDGLILNNPDAPPSKVYRYRINDNNGSLVLVDSVPLKTALLLNTVMSRDGSRLYVIDRNGVIQIFPVNRDGSLGYASVENVAEAANVLFHPTIPVAYVATAGVHNVSSTSLLSFNIIDNVYLNLVPFGSSLSLDDIGYRNSIVDPSGKSIFLIGGSVNSTLNQAFIQQQDGSLFNLTSIPLTGTRAGFVASLQLPKYNWLKLDDG